MDSKDTSGLVSQASPMRTCTARLNIRLDTDELKYIKHRAALAGMTTSEFVRRRCLGSDSRSIVNVDVEELRAIHVQLRRTGNNLNQIARELNTRHKPEEIESLIHEALRRTAEASTQIAQFIVEIRQSV